MPSRVVTARSVVPSAVRVPREYLPAKAAVRDSVSVRGRWRPATKAAIPLELVLPECCPRTNSLRRCRESLGRVRSEGESMRIAQELLPRRKSKLQHRENAVALLKGPQHASLTSNVCTGSAESQHPSRANYFWQCVESSPADEPLQHCLI